MSGSMVTVEPEVEQALATIPAESLPSLPLFDTSTHPGIAYAYAKRANQVRVRAASLSWGSKGARVVSISPGVIATPMGRQELEGASGEHMRQLIDASGTGRIGTPDDVAAAVEFLVSPAASFITGVDLLVDGGAVAAMRYGARG
jgi:NAD(P)-dependent dehydrogenase (short-subunit alcohol dehydrogenase family)